MSSLKTYDRVHADGTPADIGLKTVDEDQVWAPGVWVTDRAVGGLGMIVAINDEQVTVLWSVEPKWPVGFSNIALPLVRRVFNPQIAQQLISVQPMTAPTSAIFYMDHKYGCKSSAWWSSLIKRATCTTSGKSRRWWRFSSSSLGSASSRKSTSVDYEKQLVKKLATDPAFLAAARAPSRFGRTAGASECPPAALEKTRTRSGT